MHPKLQLMYINTFRIYKFDRERCRYSRLLLLYNEIYFIMFYILYIELYWKKGIIGFITKYDQQRYGIPTWSWCTRLGNLYQSIKCSLNHFFYLILLIPICICVHECMYICVSVCMCVQKSVYVHTDTYMCISCIVMWLSPFCDFNWLDNVHLHIYNFYTFWCALYRCLLFLPLLYL